MEDFLYIELTHRVYGWYMYVNCLTWHIANVFYASTDARCKVSLVAHDGVLLEKTLKKWANFSTIGRSQIHNSFGQTLPTDIENHDGFVHTIYIVYQQ